MIIIKSDADLTDIRKAGHIWKLTKDYIIQLLNKNPYRSLLQLDDLIDKFIRSQHASSTFLGMYGFPKHVCISVNDCVIHGIPDNYVLKDGDKVTFDIGVTYNNHVCDSAFNYLMPHVSEAYKRIVAVCEESLRLGMEQVKAGNHVGDIGHAISDYITKQGYCLLPDYTGHGCGNKLHEDPYIYNYGEIGKGPILRKNMVICIEPMIMTASDHYYTVRDWNVIASNHLPVDHVENMLLVTENGYEILNN